MCLTIWPVSTWLFLWIPPGHIQFHSLVFISPMYWVNLIIPFKQKDYNGGNACKESPSKNVWYYSSLRHVFASSSSNRLSVRRIIWGMYQFIMKALVLSLHMAPISSFSRKTSVILAFRNLLTCKTQLYSFVLMNKHGIFLNLVSKIHACTTLTPFAVYLWCLV